MTLIHIINMKALCPKIKKSSTLNKVVWQINILTLCSKVKVINICETLSCINTYTYKIWKLYDKKNQLFGQRSRSQLPHSTGYILPHVQIHLVANWRSLNIIKPIIWPCGQRSRFNVWLTLVISEEKIIQYFFGQISLICIKY